ARSLVPAGFEMTVVDAGTPEFAAALPAAEYFVGFPRAELGTDFYRHAPNMKLVQLISAAYDRLHAEAARRARVPGAPHSAAEPQQRRRDLGGGGRAPPDADAPGLPQALLAPRQRGDRQVAGGRLRLTSPVRARGQDPRHRRARHHRQEGGPPRGRLRRAHPV